MNLKLICTFFLSVVLSLNVPCVLSAASSDQDLIAARAGDANQDGKVDANDYMLLQWSVSSKNTLPAVVPRAWDVNGDATVTYTDLALLEKILLYENYSQSVAIDMEALQNSYRMLGRGVIQNNSLYFDMTAAGFSANLRCTGDVFMDLIWSGKAGMIEVTVDGDSKNKRRLTVQEGENHLQIAQGLAPGDHSFSIVKLTELGLGTAQVRSLEFKGIPLAKSTEKKLQLEFYGDSITCGLWNMTPSQTIATLPEGLWEDGTATYAAEAARLLNAEYSVIATSGAGLLFGYGQNKENTLAHIWNKAAPASSPSVEWDFSKNPADVVVINLGTNDSSSFWDSNGENPSQEAFGAACEVFLRQIRQKHPAAMIVWANGMMGEGAFVPEIKKAIQAMHDPNIFYISLPENRDAGDTHPSLAAHKKSGTLLAQEIARRLKATQLPTNGIAAASKRVSP